jgi:hypothetical protein
MWIIVFIVLIVGAAFWVNSRIDLRGSYIKENVPPASEFDKLLQRDLLEYFRSKTSFRPHFFPASGNL